MANKYGSLPQVPTTANEDLYQTAKTAKGWTSYTPMLKVSFIPDANCTILINGQTEDPTPVTSTNGWSDAETQITSFVVIEAGINFIISYRY